MTDQSTTERIAELERKNAELVKALQAFADSAYCRYIDQLRRDECLGVEYKMEHGKFGQAELKAHCKAAEHLGAHRAIHSFIRQYQQSHMEQSTTASHHKEDKAP